MKYLILWLAVGLISTFISIDKFRPSGTIKPGELYLAALGSFFGPIVAILMFIDIIKEKKV